MWKKKINIAFDFVRTRLPLGRYASNHSCDRAPSYVVKIDLQRYII